MNLIGPEGCRSITVPMCEAYMKGLEGKAVTVTELCAMPDYVREAYQMGVEAMRKERAK